MDIVQVWGWVYEKLTSLSPVADAVSLVVSVAVYLSISKMRKFYLYAARAPELISKLEEIASQISSQLNSFNGSSTEIHKLLAQAEVSLKALQNGAKGNIKSLIKSSVKELKGISKQNGNLSDEMREKMIEIDRMRLEGIYLSIYKITVACRENYESLKWER